MLSCSFSQLLLRLKNTLVIFPTDMLVLLCPFAFLISCGQSFAMCFFSFLNWFLPSPKFFSYDNRRHYLLKIWSLVLFGFLHFFFIVMTLTWILLIANHITNMRSFKDNFCILCIVKNLKICFLVLPYCFSGSQKGDPCSSCS